MPAPEPSASLPLNFVRRGDGPPLLLLHSLGGTLSQWNPVIGLLAAERDVVAVDMPGFGDSPAMPAGREASPQNLAAAVLEFVRTLELKGRPGVAGISLGSWVSIECGRQGGVDSVVALCPAGFWPGPLAPSRSRAYAAARAIRPFARLLLRNQGLRHRALAANVRNPERVPFEDAVELVRGYGGAEGYVDANHHMRAGTIGELDSLPVPLTIAWAEFDRLVRNRPLPADALPAGVRQVVLPGCGHVPTWDDPELVARTILEGTRVESQPLQEVR